MIRVRFFDEIVRCKIILLTSFVVFWLRLYSSVKNIVNPFKVGVAINEKMALFKKMYPLSGDRLGVGSFFYSKALKFYQIMRRDIFKYLR